MAAEENKGIPGKSISDKERFKYIGFDVFPGKPKDLFKSEAEKTKLVEQLLNKRSKGETLRDHCTLLEERVSFSDRLVLTIASLVIIATLFIPWYSVYNEIIEQSKVEQEPVLAVSADSMMATSGDSLLAMSDSAAVTAGATNGEATAQKNVTKTGASEEVISGYVAKKKVRTEYSRLSALGAILSLGSVGSYVFSSGGVLVLSAILFIIYTLLCIALPILNMYGLYALKGSADQKAVHLKKLLRFNWIPLILFVIVVVFSFFGADYGFDSATIFTSLGSSYGPGVLLGTISWGIIISLGASILIAAKGIEI